MKKEIKNPKTILFQVTLSLFVLVGSLLNTAKADCENTIPNPLDPNCTKNAADLSVGGLANRFIAIIPIVITLVTIFAIARGAVKIILADDAEKRQAGFKSIINAAIGAAVFYSIWLILFLIEYFTGAELIPFTF
jgi:cation transport ATPase